MAKTAISELQQQIEEVRREAFRAGYVAAMRAIHELASRPTPFTGITAPRQRGDGARKASPSPPGRRRQARVSERPVKSRRSAASRPQRGANAQRVEQILKDVAPRALRAGEIRRALQDKHVEMSFTSIRHALAQLKTRNAAEQVDSKTWRHSPAAS
jgi:hypothetical protein